MRSIGIKAQWIKPYAVTTIDSNFSSEYKNILNEDFNPDSSDAVWCSDITYIWTLEGFVYLTSIMDLLVFLIYNTHSILLTKNVDFQNYISSFHVYRKLSTDFPLKYPIKLETLIFGGILTNIWI